MGDNRIALKGLVDANYAGTPDGAIQCTLILTTGKAAASLIEAGISAIEGGLNYFGIYTIGGHLMNVRRRTPNESRENREVNALMVALGLEFGNEYADPDVFGTLRYGRVMLATGQVSYGSKMKGLVINLFHEYWLSLLKRDGFLTQMITPVVKVLRQNGEEISFYTLEHFHRFEIYNQEESVNSPYMIREYKSLESFTPEEMRQYFSQIEYYRVKFQHQGTADDEAIIEAFEVGGDRKSWLEDVLSRAVQHVYPLYFAGVRVVTYKDFIDREYSLCCDESLERAIPSVVDGLTKNQRKVLYTFLTRYPDQEVSVLQLIGSVFEVSAYMKTFNALGDTIVHMAQDFVGKGNINLLLPYRGQFGTRMKGGKDAGRIQYLHTKLNDVTRLLFPDADKDILKYQRFRGIAIEPFHYLPVIPLILVNGANGLGPGFKTRIPKYHPVDVIENLIRLLDHEAPQEMFPFFRNFTGTVETVNDTQFQTRVSIERQGNNKILIKELPVGFWTHKYREEVLERMVRDGEISKFEDRHTDTTVDFVVTLARAFTEEDLYKKLKVVDKQGCSFQAYDEHCNVKTFPNAIEILRYFYRIRLQGYERRRERMIRECLNDEVRTQLENTSAKQLWKRELEELLQRPEIRIQQNIHGLAEAIAELHS